MQIYLEPIRKAFLFFPLIAFLITIPYLIYQYHKYGSVPLLRSVIVYTFILYLLTAYFLVILPLPSKTTVANMPSIIPQLIPFRFIKDIMQHSYHDILDFFTSPTVYTIIFNLFLTLPLGIYLRYYFQKKWYQVILIAFSVSLFFEITQLTGLYGIYSKAYRLFDVDDLIINTLGAILGMLITPILTKFLPSRIQLDEISYTRGQQVSIYRRGIAFLIDIFCYIVLICFSFLFSSIHHRWMILLVIYYIILPLLTNGKTVGKAMVQIKLESVKHFYLSVILRQILLYIFLLPAPYWLYHLWNYSSSYVIINFFVIFIFFLYLFYYFRFLWQILKALLGKQKYLFYEIWTHTTNVNTITMENSSQEIENMVE